MKLPSLFQFRILKEAFTALFKGHYTTRFPFVPHKPPEKFRGKPVPDDDWCVGCGACAEVCPSHAIELIDEPKTATRRIIWHYDQCIFCGQCEANCLTEKGVHLTGEYDLAVFDRKELFSEQKKELLICERCGRIIGTREHLLWLVKKLGPLAYSNFPLILTAQKELKIVKEEAPSKVPPPTTRSDIFRILCPKCRHEVLLLDQYGGR
ncbi:MAG: 4Fe-4S ferredoxin [bacterium (Candidatus Ratteibacteria) CG_4_9_14_3_um_filter_41_21]|uniref:4Fe-4S ferredoxin n=1 Tax=bacterium (Candidatus Ratteibacteria) CG_4_9_14_3_um_filter_41_21 TaxID=2014289 RepID=A0A2M7YED9_9BACT|nr:MAG: 4Fe-4S ferredoxin [bacterium (Candidatus Ratteibacteria) CG_4_9_14_3_um_filter_41_21]